jgi:hypothetical protein
MASESRAETISMTLSVGGGPSLVVDVVPGVTATATSYNVDGTAGPGNYPGTLALGTINAFLAAAGSEYQFISLGGSSNFPGSPLPANLTVTGEIHAVGANGTNAGLTLTETESGFTNPPPGATATLRSSSTGNFTNQPAGGGHEASSSINTTSTPSYTVLSTGPGVNPGVSTGPTSAPITSVPTLYTLTNVISWGVSAPGLAHPGAGGPDVVDQFGVTSQVSAVPEPASVVTMLMGTPLPLAVLWLLRRRRSLA